MQDILDQLDLWTEQGEDAALATLVRVRGSAPRLPGARLCLTRSGKMAGSVSGGCVENDVFEHAVQVLDSGVPALASYGISDEMGFEVGLSCGGTIDVLVERFARDEAWDAARKAVESGESAVLAIALGPPELLGRRMCLQPGGARAGAIAPEIDDKVAALADELLSETGTQVASLESARGQVDVFLEAFHPPPRLYIVGATHTAIPLCRMAKQTGFHVTVIDARSLFATPERFPEADEIIRAWPDEALEPAKLNAHSFIVVLTHDPKFDLPTLSRALRSEARYIGAMGSRATHEKRKAKLLEEGFRPADLARIHAPIGLDIGARKPEEIAVAILAEVLAARYGRDGTPLSERGATVVGGG